MESFPSNNNENEEINNNEQGMEFVVSDVLDYINSSRLGFKVKEEQVEKALGVLMKEDSDEKKAASDLKEIISFLEPGDDFDKAVDVFSE